jgi:hypothetical protein
VWISGPPGYGKTTLAGTYLRSRRLQSVWYQLDADDADPASFFHYLRHAAVKVLGAQARDLPAFSAQHGDDVSSFARSFFRQLFAHPAHPLALVLDNLQAVPAESALPAALEVGFSQVPKGCCVIVTSRSEPPAALARLRATGSMCCVTGAELSVSCDEIVAIGRARTNRLLEAARLRTAQAGWPACSDARARALSGRIVDLPGIAAPQVIFDYLAGEIFDRFDPGTRDFLLRIACLPRMTVEVAEALSGEPKAGRLLVNLALNDYFVREVPSEAGRLYQLHPLLREFLRNRAAQSLPRLSRRRAQRAASCCVTGQTEMRSPSWSRPVIGAGGADALEEADAILAQGRSETLAGWLDMLPREMIDADPRLLRICAAARAHASPRAARQLYERAYQGFRSIDDTSGMVQCCCGIIDAIILEFDDVTPLDVWIGALGTLLERDVPGARAPTDLVAVTTLIRPCCCAMPGIRTSGAGGAAEMPRRRPRLGNRPRNPAARRLRWCPPWRCSAGRPRRADATLEELRVGATDRTSNEVLALALTDRCGMISGDGRCVARHQTGLALAGSEGLHAYDG